MFSTPSCNSVQHDYEKGEASNKKQNKKNKKKNWNFSHQACVVGPYKTWSSFCLGIFEPWTHME